MSETIERLQAEDFDEAIAFLGHAFNLNDMTFDQLLPSIYRRDTASMSCNLCLRRHGDIAAIVGVFPQTWAIGDTRFQVAGIGGVSTGTQYRGSGYMRKLMHAAMATIADEGYDLSVLGGQRQRYAYWGYERCGPELVHHLSPSCIKHSFTGATTLSLHLMGESREERDAVHALHEAQPSRVDRPPDLLRDCLRNWHMQPYIARDRDGRIVAALSATPKTGDIYELLATDADAGVDTLRVWCAMVGRAARLLTSPLPTKLNQRIAAIAETSHYDNGGNWLVRHWPATLNALLKLHHRHTPLADGHIVLGFRDGTTSLALTVDGEHATCTPTDEAPALILDPLAMHRLLFAPTSPDLVTTLPAAAAILRAWCPLPLWISRPDHV